MSIKISELTAWVAAITSGEFPMSISGTTYKVTLSNFLAPLDSPALTGNPTAPTQLVSNDSTRIATTAFVKTNLGYYFPLTGATVSGDTVFDASGITNFDNNVHIRTGGIFLLDTGGEIRNSGLISYYTGTTWNYSGSSPANHRSALGLGTLATQSGTFSGTSSGTNTGDQVISDATITTTDIVTNNASTSKHGFLKKLSDTVTEYMDGTGAWSTPAGSINPTTFMVLASLGG